MKRRNKHDASPPLSFLDAMTTIPTWKWPVVIAGTYVFVRYMIPGLVLFAGGPSRYRPALPPEERAAMVAALTPVFKQMCQVLAPLLTAALLIFWMVVLIAKYRNRLTDQKTKEMRQIRALGWNEFEQMCAAYFRQRGFSVEPLRLASSDDTMGFILRDQNQVVLVQCRHWRSLHVGAKPVHELLNLLAHENVTHGMLVTGGTFTDEARTLAERNAVVLLDGYQWIDIYQKRDSMNKTPVLRKQKV